MLWRLLRWLFSGHVFEVLALFLAAIGVSMGLAPDKDDILRAHWFFGAAFLLGAGRLAYWLMSEQALTPKPLIAAVCFALVGGGWMATYQWVESKAPPRTAISKPVAVTVSPRSLLFSIGTSGTTYPFTVKNISDADVYSVVVQISVESSAVERQAFNASAPEDGRHLIYEDKMGQIFDPIILGARNNSSHYLEFWFLVYRLKAGETREFTLTRSRAGDSVNVSASVLSFNKTAQPLIAENGNVKFRFLDKWISVTLKPLGDKIKPQ